MPLLNLFSPFFKEITRKDNSISSKLCRTTLEYHSVYFADVAIWRPWWKRNRIFWFKTITSRHGVDEKVQPRDQPRFREDCRRSTKVYARTRHVRAFKSFSEHDVSRRRTKKLERTFGRDYLRLRSYIAAPLLIIWKFSGHSIKIRFRWKFQAQHFSCCKSEPMASLQVKVLKIQNKKPWQLKNAIAIRKKRLVSSVDTFIWHQYCSHQAPSKNHLHKCSELWLRIAFFPFLSSSFERRRKARKSIIQALFKNGAKHNNARKQKKKDVKR